MDSTSAHELMRAYLEEAGPVLCLDIGFGTQDVLLALPGETPENWPRLVLPSPARRIGRRLEELAKAGRSVWFTGATMGDGFVGGVRKLLAMGLGVAATERIARALSHAPARGGEPHVEVTDSCPAGFVPVTLGDYDAGAWETLLSGQGLLLPNEVLACAKDHGGTQDSTNEDGTGGRHCLLRHVAERLVDNADPATWVEAVPSGEFGRLCALHEATGGMVSDSGPAVLVGCLLDETMKRRSFREGVTFVNVGNDHVFAALLYRGRVRGIYEHHVHGLSRECLLSHLDEFRRGFLSTDVVVQSGGHGTIYGPECPEAGDYAPTFLCGPNRGILHGCGVELAPFGAMMHAGCFGLLYARARARFA